MPPHATVEPIFEGPPVFQRSEVAKFVDLREVKEKGSKTAEAHHETPWYTIIDNKVYDIREFVAEHPGGAVILTHIGKDATDVFSAFHSENAYEILANYYVGDLALEGLSTIKEGFTQELREIKQLMKKEDYFSSSKSYYFLKFLSNIAIWAVSVMILAKFGNTTIGLLSSAVIMGLFWQQCGWLSHDFLHHQVFEDRRLGNLMGAFLGGVCQGFSLSWWKDKHNTHHAAPNVHGQDPDIDTHPLLTWSEHALGDLFDPGMVETFPKPQVFGPLLARFLVQYQAFFYFPILCIARISWCIQSVLFVLPDGQNGKPANARIPILPIEQVSLGVHYAWYSSIIYLYIQDLGHALAFVLVSQAACGLLLALVFSLNHNGMQVLTEKESQDIDFFVEQVITSRNVLSSNPSFQWWIDWFCGGLNYQIEHHLFPSIPRHNFHKIQPAIQKLCEKYQVPYHRTTFWEGTLEVFDRLVRVSAASKNLD